MSAPDPGDYQHPWRCRHGWHKWRYVSMDDVRTIDVPGLQLHHVCTLVERCDRCPLRRTRRAADVPKRPKMSARRAPCPRCKGSGRWGDDTAVCLTCGGSGTAHSGRTGDTDAR